MGTEIERKFLVHYDLLPWGEFFRRSRLKQGYLTEDPAVRIRVTDDQLTELNIKAGSGGVNQEFHYTIPFQDALDMLLLAKFGLEKNRHLVNFGSLKWEVDEFLGPLKSKDHWLAEVELDRLDQEIKLPLWVGREVTDDPRYSNTWIAKYGWPPDVLKVYIPVREHPKINLTECVHVQRMTLTPDDAVRIKNGDSITVTPQVEKFFPPGTVVQFQEGEKPSKE